MARQEGLTGFIRGDPQFGEELDALEVILEKQTLTGIVQNDIAGAPAHFDLILDAGSYLSILHHPSGMAVDIVQQPATNPRGDYFGQQWRYGTTVKSAVFRL